MQEENNLLNVRTVWDHEAATFDDEPDHGLRDPVVKAAWEQLLRQWLPATPSRVLDVGCGTGSLTVLAAALGHTVLGVDSSPEMIKLAQVKAAAHDLPIVFQLMDAAKPTIAPEGFDAVMCRHLLWALPDPPVVLERWKRLLAPAGRMLLIEGFWMTGAGLKMAEIISILPRGLAVIETINLSPLSVLWGKPVTDERYVILLGR